MQWQSESRTLEQEKAEFGRRTKAIERRKTATLDGHVFLEPRNESELFGLLMGVYSLRPGIFQFEPLDYNTTRGIDIIARNKSESRVADSDFWYVELKYELRETFNHAFKNLRWIVCWDFDRRVSENSEFRAIEESDVRRLMPHKNEDGKTSYFLDNPAAPLKIQVIRLVEFLKETLGLEFKSEPVRQK
jgi:hypothetical protein